MKVITTHEAPKPRLIPEAVINLYESVNALTRVIRVTCEGAERLAIGVDEITTICLAQQKERLLSELTARKALT